MTKMTPFVIRTHDEAWIARNNGTVDGDGRVTVMVPAAHAEHVMIAGVPMIRHVFRDVPADFAREALCPASWLE